MIAAAAFSGIRADPDTELREITSGGTSAGKPHADR
jgi:hypothetical protein